MKRITIKRSLPSERLIDQVVKIESVLFGLPPLSTLEKTQLDNNRAIEELYYSSKLEGTGLTKKRIEQAIYGKGLSTT